MSPFQPKIARSFGTIPATGWRPCGAGYGPSSAVRLGDWKYIFYHDPGKNFREELFNIHEDIGETKNLAEAKPEKLKELRQALKDYLAKVDAQMPIDKKTKKLIEIPGKDLP